MLYMYVHMYPVSIHKYCTVLHVDTNTRDAHQEAFWGSSTCALTCVYHMYLYKPHHIHVPHDHASFTLSGRGIPQAFPFFCMKIIWVSIVWNLFCPSWRKSRLLLGKMVPHVRLNYLFARFWFSCQLKIYPPTHVWGIVESEHFDLLKALEFYFRPQPAIILKFSKYPQICEGLLVDVLLAEMFSTSQKTASKMPNDTVTVLRFWAEFWFLALFTDWGQKSLQAKKNKATPKLT